MPSLLGAFVSIISYRPVFLLQPIIRPLWLVNTSQRSHFKERHIAIKVGKRRLCEDFKSGKFEEQPDSG